MIHKVAGRVPYPTSAALATARSAAAPTGSRTPQATAAPTSSKHPTGSAQPLPPPPATFVASGLLLPFPLPLSLPLPLPLISAFRVLRCFGAGRNVSGNSAGPLGSGRLAAAWAACTRRERYRQSQVCGHSRSA
jgi:hypothetical protein